MKAAAARTAALFHAPPPTWVSWATAAPVLPLDPDDVERELDEERVVDSPLLDGAAVVVVVVVDTRDAMPLAMVATVVHELVAGMEKAAVGVTWSSAPLV